MAQIVVLMAGLLLLAESQASDVADRSTHPGFLSKSDYDKFITPNLNRVKHGNELDASPFTVVDDKPVLQSSAQAQEKQAADPISLSIFGIGLVSFVTMLGLTLWKALQPATIPTNTVSALGGQVMEMKSQDPNVRVNSGRVGWGQQSSQSAGPLTPCYGLFGRGSSSAAEKLKPDEGFFFFPEENIVRKVSLESGNMITEAEVAEAQKAWADGIIEIGRVYTGKGDYKAEAERVIAETYGWKSGLDVLFKPTKASDEAIRLDQDSALSYFVGASAVPKKIAVSEDKGFAITPFTAIRWDNKKTISNGKSATAMGEYYFTDSGGGVTKAEYTFQYERAADGSPKIVVHHSSLPFSA